MDAYLQPYANSAQDFENTKEDARELYDLKEEFFRNAESKFSATEKTVNDAIQKYIDDFATNQEDCLQMTQVWRELFRLRMLTLFVGVDQRASS